MEWFGIILPLCQPHYCDMQANALYMNKSYHNKITCSCLLPIVGNTLVIWYKVIHNSLHSFFTIYRKDKCTYSKMFCCTLMADTQRDALWSKSLYEFMGYLLGELTRMLLCGTSIPIWGDCQVYWSLYVSASICGNQVIKYKDLKSRGISGFWEISFLISEIYWY